MLRRGLSIGGGWLYIWRGFIFGRGYLFYVYIFYLVWVATPTTFCFDMKCGNFGPHHIVALRFHCVFHVCFISSLGAISDSGLANTKPPTNKVVAGALKGVSESFASKSGAFVKCFDTNRLNQT